MAGIREGVSGKEHIVISTQSDRTLSSSSLEFLREYCDYLDFLGIFVAIVIPVRWYFCSYYHSRLAVVW